MAGKLHCLLQCGTALVQQCHERMAQAVEVGKEWTVAPLDDVGDSACVQINAEHVGRAVILLNLFHCIAARTPALSPDCRAAFALAFGDSASQLQ